MPINSRSKGQRAERSVIHLLQPVVNEVWLSLDVLSKPPMLQRNTIQAHKGGYDIVGLDWIAIEVKHNEKLDLESWWQQATRQAGTDKIPVLLYKQNSVKFRAMLRGSIGKIETPVDVPFAVFEQWFREQCYVELGCRSV